MPMTPTTTTRNTWGGRRHTLSAANQRENKIKNRKAKDSPTHTPS